MEEDRVVLSAGIRSMSQPEELLAMCELGLLVDVNLNKRRGK